MSDNFYTSIARYYQHIFPANPAHIRFLSNILPYNGARVLDVGCAIGELSFALARFGFPTWGIDVDAEMIDIANNSKSEDTIFPIFERLDMRLFDQHYPGAFFDTIICFGNTLVHLLNDEDIRQFLRAAWHTLSPDGTLTIQILNYSHILENNIRSLPIINNEQITFERSYEFTENSDLIDFNTRLTVKATGQVIQNTVKLYAVTQKKVDELMEESGFERIEYFGNFERDPLKKDSLTLIFTAKKKDDKKA